MKKNFTKYVLLFLFFVFGFQSFSLFASARDKLVDEAKLYLGYPYSYGSAGPNSFDCSGYVYYVTSKALNIQLPRTAKAMYSACKLVSDKDRDIGDLVFFATTSSGKVSHVGIYLGNNKFISALSEGANKGISISSLEWDYWRTRYIGAGQFLSTVSKEEPIVVKADDEEFEEEFEPRDSWFTVDFGGNVTWAITSFTDFTVKVRGADLYTDIRATKIPLQPALGVGLKINDVNSGIQVPLLLSFTSKDDILRLYGGPIITFRFNGTNPEIYSEVIGISVATPTIHIGRIGIQVAQDVNYTINNNAINLFSLGGLMLNTGLKLSYDL